MLLTLLTNCAKSRSQEPKETEGGKGRERGGAHQLCAGVAFVDERGVWAMSADEYDETAQKICQAARELNNERGNKRIARVCKYNELD